MSVKKGYDELTREQWDDRQRLEKVVDEGLAHSIETGKALLELHSRRLYRASHRSWEQYLAKRFGIGRQWSYKLMASARFWSLLELSPRGDSLPKPADEMNTRPLNPFDDKTKLELWEKASAQSGGQTPTRDAIEKAAEELLASLDEEQREKVLAPRSAGRRKPADTRSVQVRRLERAQKHAQMAGNALARIEDGERARELAAELLEEIQGLLA